MHKFYLIILILTLLKYEAYTQKDYTANDLSNRNNNKGSYEPFIKTYTTRYGNGLINLKNQNKSLLQFIEYVLATNGLPKQLKNLAIIESSLNNKTLSWAGAAGPWQFMPETAQQFGLTINSHVDERYDIYKSTYAVVKYLKQLYQRYKNWDLVIAAYNSGTAHVDRAIKINNSTSFWDIQYNLPTETRNHVKKFIGTAYVIDGLADNTFSEKTHVSANIDTKFSTERITAGFRLDVIAEQLNNTLVDLQRWNPNFEQKLSANGEYLLKLPINKMPEFLLFKNEILNTSIQKNLQLSTNDH